MRKVRCFLLLIISAGFLLLSMDQAFLNKLKQDRYFDHLNPPAPANRSLYYRCFVRSDRWRYGDLYGVCFLPQYKFTLEPFKKYSRGEPAPATGRVLYIIGDSYLADKSLGGAFKGFDNVVFLDRRFPFGPIKLDSTRKNYLIMEFAERNLNDYDLNKTAEVKWTNDEIRAKQNFNTSARTSTPDLSAAENVFSRLGRIVFNKDLSRNLELLLFDDKAFTSIKETKASLNYKMFGRTPKEVAVSTDKKRLLMNITIDTSFRESGFRTISDAELSQLVVNLDAAKNYYRAIGFDKVILSVIPNAVSVYDVHRMNYNHLLERVEKCNTFPVISIFNQFKMSKVNLYYRSDTHWNPLGLDVWVAETDKMLNAR